MTRNHKSAKKAGTLMEQAVADYLSWALADGRIIRQPKHGAKDLGDIANIRFMGQIVCVECKNTAAKSYAKHMREAQVEALNQDAPYYWVVQKRPGIGLAHRGTVGLQLCYTTPEVLDKMRIDAPDDLFLANTGNFERLTRTGYWSCTLRSFATILNHGLPLGEEMES